MPSIAPRTLGQPRLKIAQVAPLYESVPPQLYGGTERIVSYLTEELVRRGHDVTLFASGDSRTAARLVEGCPRSLRLAGCADALPHHLLMLEKVYDGEFDIIHFHVDYLHFPVSRRERRRHVTTLHGRLDLPDTRAVYAGFGDMPVVSISDAQRTPQPGLAWQGTVYHGLPADLYRLSEAPGDDLAFIGRVSPEKRLDLAIEIARRAGRRLRVAAKIDRADRPYYDAVLAPLIRQPHVELVGEIGEADKQAFLGGAGALLFPIDWPEPFGLVMIEAMACGTPVVAFRRGSVAEVIDDGVTGFVCDGIDDAVRAIERLPDVPRAGCRHAFERRFTADRMTDDYVRVYQQLIARPHDAREHPEPVQLLHPRHQHARG